MLEAQTEAEVVAALNLAAGNGLNFHAMPPSYPPVNKPLVIPTQRVGPFLATRNLPSLRQPLRCGSAILQLTIANLFEALEKVSELEVRNKQRNRHQGRI